MLPTTPYERAQARFWADYIDKKVFDAGKGIWTSSGEEQEVAKKEFIEVVKQLEELALGEKDFFGGDAFGYVDILAIGLTSWFFAYEKIGGFKLEDHCPKYSSWIKRCLQRPSVAKALSNPEHIYHFVLQMRKMMTGAE
ncbi:glutathione S-transferase U19-like [Senna tora]|uniref:Glutathione S-transferase U19-like n=1 Tax=Senna tora TaxID=362788 RepID=A0A834T6Y8_9FABA|nr:glutathione S-transferase U19-like [Senna tora]